MKVILNFPPPGRIDFPSPAMSILSSFLKINGHESEVKYWNVLMSDVMAYYSYENDVVTPLFPFLSLFADEYGDTDIQNKLLISLQAYQPYFKTKTHFYTNSLNEIGNEALRIIREELDKTELNEVKLLGISARYYQWLPGRIIAREFKNRIPDVKIVAGGFGEAASASAILKVCSEFDYAIWGEGEYPLLELVNSIEAGNNDPGSIPRLLYRDGDDIRLPGNNKSMLLDLDSDILPDHGDFIKAAALKNISKNHIHLTINTNRGCGWSKCLFCTYHKGSSFRERKSPGVIAEINTLSEMYGVNYFYFVDNDLTGSNISRFEALLDELINYKKTHNPEMKLNGEMIPHNGMTSEIFGKMKIAGFDTVFTGIDGLSDTMLNKMRKRNSFAVNLAFVKNAIRNGITPHCGIVYDIPDETLNDIAETIENLHFMRFFYNNNAEPHFRLKKYPLKLYKQSGYYDIMDDNERCGYNDNNVYYHLPGEVVREELKYDVFGFWKTVPTNDIEWRKYGKIEKYYTEHHFSYKLEIEDNNTVYTEYLDDREITRIPFEDGLFSDILKHSGEIIRSLEELHELLSHNYPGLTPERLKEALGFLKSKYMVYFNVGMSEIFSVV
ncbi:MAG: radical SAM protein [Bacteroidetes bacterium]|nr:radical SAM protein [Bacteroidota bacterium]